MVARLWFNAVELKPARALCWSKNASILVAINKDSSPAKGNAHRQEDALAHHIRSRCRIRRDWRSRSTKTIYNDEHDRLELVCPPQLGFVDTTDLLLSLPTLPLYLTRSTLLPRYPDTLTTRTSSICYLTSHAHTHFSKRSSSNPGTLHSFLHSYTPNRPKNRASRLSI